MIEHVRLLRNVGQFDSVDAGANILLTKLALVYAENGRGKTTLASILRSLSTGNADLITDRKRLGSSHPPHIVLAFAGAAITFQNGAWSALHPKMMIFDDSFVAANVCSGIEIETVHKQNLHEWILGAQGVALNQALQDHVSRIEEHNRALRQKADAVPSSTRGTLTIDGFCDLPADSAVDDKLEAAQRKLAAARAAEPVRLRPAFTALVLPVFDNATLSALLARTLPDLQADAAARVREHLKSLGRGGEAWVGEGITRAAEISQSQFGAPCPFCAQDLGSSVLMQAYEVYFSDAYKALKSAITDTGQSINAIHGGEVAAAFERAVRVAVENRNFWKSFTEVPEIAVDTAEIARAWKKARDLVLAVLRAKAAAPLEAMALNAETLAALTDYETQRMAVVELSTALLARNGPIAIVKEQASGANIGGLTADLARLASVKARHEPTIAALCSDYLNEKVAKKATERQRDKVRGELDAYRQNIFPLYEAAINKYLERFNAGFRLRSVSPLNSRGGSSVNYTVLMNNTTVALTSDSGPCFRNTLSAGDRNTLALAFFFASLDQDAQLSEKIVILDDPMTSLDEHRSLTTVQEVHRLYGRVSQVVVLSHSKPFLCSIWEGAEKGVTRSAIRILREGSGSTLAAWDVKQDCITEHDRRHEMVRNYIKMSSPERERQVAAALRPILEAFMRVACPAMFPPGTLLGPFLTACEKRCGKPDEELSETDIGELRALLVYANRFHHDTNLAWETATINDQELVGFSSRTLKFASRQ